MTDFNINYSREEDMHKHGVIFPWKIRNMESAVIGIL